jgi:hypothetical protein
MKKTKRYRFVPFTKGSGRPKSRGGGTADAAALRPARAVARM